MKDSVELIEQIKLMKSNKFYRLGDLIYGKGMRWKRDREVIVSSDLYNGSLLRGYLDGIDKPNQTRFDSELWSRVVKDKITKDKIQVSDESLVIHVRAGDVVANNNQIFTRLLGLSDDLDEIKKITNGRYYAWAIISQGKIYDKINDKIADNKFKNVIVITGLHFGDNELLGRFEFSEEALNINKILFKILFDKIQDHYGMPVSIPRQKNEINNIDDHLIRLIVSKHKILDSPGWARIVNDTKL